MPPNMIAAARRVYGRDERQGDIEEERELARNVKELRRMNEIHIPGVRTRGRLGTPQTTVTWAFVWCLRNGLLPDQEYEDFEDGFPVLPDCVAALVIERALCDVNPDDGSRNWVYLLWRAIFSECIRRQAQERYAQEFDSLPKWTSRRSHQAWQLFVGDTQDPSFGFAAETRSEKCRELDLRFEDARLAFKRTLRTWRTARHDAGEIATMPSLEASEIPRKFTTTIARKVKRWHH